MQRKLYKRMEDAAYVYRSIYVEHLQTWLRQYPPNQLLVLPTEALKDGNTRSAAFSAFAAVGHREDSCIRTLRRPPDAVYVMVLVFSP